MSLRDLRPRERSALLQALRAGVTPRLGASHIQVGRDAEITALNRDLDGTPEFLTDPHRGLYSYPALQSRLAENPFVRNGLVDLTSMANGHPQTMEHPSHACSTLKTRTSRKAGHSRMTMPRLLSIRKVGAGGTAYL